MEDLRESILRIAEENQPASLRNLFYCAVSEGLVPKEEREYKAVMRLVLELRREGLMPWDWVVDATRWMRKPSSYVGLGSMLRRSQQHYRRDLWADQAAYVEVWCESESLAGVLGEVTEEFDVPLMPGRGYSSHAFLHSAALTLDGQLSAGKKAFIYYVGDHDPSGLDIDRHVRDRLHEYAVGVSPDTSEIPFVFKRLAVTREQIVEMGLPTRPAKAGDTRARGFEGGCVEAEAIKPEKIRAIVREAIEQHLDSQLLKRTREIEEQERTTLAHLARALAVRDDAGVSA